MFAPQWQYHLQSALSRARQLDREVALVGIGRIGHGDDAAGPQVIHDLRQMIADQPGMLLFDAAAAPENLCGAILRRNPACVIFIDAAATGSPPGTVHWLPFEAASGMGASTHTLPLSLLGRFLSSEGHCEVHVMAIEAAQLEAGHAMSSAVHAAVIQVEKAILGALLAEPISRVQPSLPDLREARP